LRRPKLLPHNCSPSFNWNKDFDATTIARSQSELRAMGYKYQFITLIGIHSIWFNMFDLARDCSVRGRSRNPSFRAASSVARPPHISRRSAQKVLRRRDDYHSGLRIEGDGPDRVTEQAHYLH
jgi:hypothetical protein